MGRLAYLCDSVQTSSSSDNNFVAKYTMTPDVAWCSAWFTLWRSPFQPEASANNLDGGTVQILVDDTAVFEMRVHGEVASAKHGYCVVVPWGDGLVFNEGQSLGWYIENWGLQGLVGAGFTGVRI